MGDFIDYFSKEEGIGFWEGSVAGVPIIAKMIDSKYGIIGLISPFINSMFMLQLLCTDGNLLTMHMIVNTK